MRTFPTREELVAAYWRKLTRSIGAAYKGRGRVFARRAPRTLQARRGRSHSDGAAKGIPAKQAAH
jgi:hypothetical protein